MSVGLQGVLSVPSNPPAVAITRRAGSTHPMTLAPVEFLLVHYPDREFHGDVVPALVDLVGHGTVRVLDLVVILKDLDGAVTAVEIDDLPEDAQDLFCTLDGEYGGVLSARDIAVAAESIPPGASAVAMVWENSWAAQFVAAADGVTIAGDRAVLR